MDTTLFKKIGMTEAEIKVYLSLMHIGSTTIGPITNKARVSRSKIYHILNKLQNKGLVTFIKKGKTKYFNATNPEKIQDYIKYKRKELDNIEADSKKIIPKLKSIQASSEQRDEAEIYKGLEGIKTARDLSLKELKKGEIIRVFGSDKTAQDTMPAYWEEYHKKRVKLGIKGKYLMKLNSKKELDQIKRKSGLIKIKYLPVTKPVYIDIFANYVITTVIKQGDYTAFLIKNQEIANYYIEWFDKLWEKGVK